MIINPDRIAACVVLLAALLSGAGETVAARPAVIPSLTPRPTSAPVPTVTPTPAQLDLTLPSTNRLAPADVMAEMYFFGGAGGNPGLTDTCETVIKAEQPARDLMDPLVLRVCWPDPDRLVVFKVTRPDGRVESTGQWVANGEVQPVYQPPYDYPPGTYMLRLEGSKTSKETRVVYRAPQKASLSELNAAGGPFQLAWSLPGPRRRLILDHFMPGEKVRLLIFKQAHPEGDWGVEPAVAAGWQDLTVRGDGRMPVSIWLPDVRENEKLYFAAVGERSGEVHLFEISPNDFKRYDWADGTDFTCPGAKTPRLKYWSAARVAAGQLTIAQGEWRLPMRSAPGPVGPGFLLPVGAEVTLFQGSRCFDRVRYWEVSYLGYRGWVAEADEKQYFLAPAQ